MADKDALFRVKVGERLFVLDRITLGDWRMFKTEFGLNASDVFASVPNGKGGVIEILNINNPSALVALITAAQHHDEPERPLSAIVAQVEGYEMGDLEFPDLTAASEGDEAEADPTKEGADDEATVSPSKAGSSVKPRKKTGSQSSQKS